MSNNKPSKPACNAPGCPKPAAPGCNGYCTRHRRYLCPGWGEKLGRCVNLQGQEGPLCRRCQTQRDYEVGRA